MKKIIISICSLFLGYSAMAADCDSMPSKVDTNDIYAEVIRRSHMDLEFVFIRKNESSFKYKIVGGEGFSPKAMPACGLSYNDNIEASPIERAGSNVAVSTVAGGNTSFYGIFKVCLYDYLNKPIGEIALCNWETGD